MEPAFNKILIKDIPVILPFIRELTENQISEEILENRFKEMFQQNYECFGIYMNGQLIGTFGLWFMTRHYLGRSCEPDHIFISPEFRKMGIGKKLFNFIYKYAEEKGCEGSELNSYVSNYASHKFYLNESYEIRGYHFIKKL